LQNKFGKNIDFFDKILYKSKYVLPKIVNILKTTGEFGKKLSYQNTGMVSWVG